MKYIKIFQYAQALSGWVWNSYSDYKLLPIFLDNFHQSEKYCTQLAIHQAELKIENIFTDKKSLCISSQNIEYLNFDSTSGYGINNERANLVPTK